MSAVKQMRNEVKKYIDSADEKVVKMVHAMLEVDAEADWWDAMPDNVKADVEAAIKQADKGELIPHEEVKKRYPQWFSK
jgi:predicted transcriptional regulator